MTMLKQKPLGLAGALLVLGAPVFEDRAGQRNVRRTSHELTSGV
jgi:hypothetical protein